MTTPLPPHEPLGSGAQALVGYRIDLSNPNGGAVVTLEVAAKHLNRNGTLQGGIHAMMLDAAAGFAASRHLAGQATEVVPVVTLSLTTHFLAPADKGTVIATGHVRGGGRKVVYADAEICDADGTLLSQGNGIFKRTVL
ncbi:PaaI family thioesterase [Sulfitobacter aestuariivivens]|uniref:PaaI family thioesterase n=1 Tax=Sulfitobacter aestuariivivens TaxID=2766981 RepID=A0A927D5F0_9RHOB|nr:PaaI family thioesterase [Sulfitobacter aestuariivivens]MBD3664558.1 PaaI family thioesterase [Sulfitobacter aestuariivivens]